MAYVVRLEPMGLEMDVEEGETVLQAAFRQGIMLMHGCKEGQCSSCKSLLIEGDIDLMRYSTFALPDYEREQDYILLCRTKAYSDLTIELLNYDEEILQFAVPVKTFSGQVASIQTLTADIRLLTVRLGDAEDLRFFAGQYLDVAVPSFGVSRSYSLASTPQHPRDLEFIIKVYPGGEFSGLLENALRPGDKLMLTGPYGICCRRPNDAPVVLVGGGSGMAPLLSIVRDLVENQIDRPVKLFYGARGPGDLFYAQEIADLGVHFTDFEFIPALSHMAPDEEWQGERGFIHEVVNRKLERTPNDTDRDAYVCGPPPLIDAVVPVLHMKGIDGERIYFDKFFASSSLELPIQTKE